ncbi:hypothetical protein BDR03DRAFT_1011147 [Suillus americanus]|nr:hypothetical protein BDR03DRAFT_1011147 [Suillus americanus]
MLRLFTRHLIIRSHDLGKDVTIMLALVNEDMQGLYEDSFPVVWKVTKFGKTGPYMSQVTYTNQLAFAKGQVVDGNYVTAATSINLNAGQKTTLTGQDQDDDYYTFSTAVAGAPGSVQAVNKTGLTQDLAVGFLNKGDFTPTPALYFPDIKDGSQVTAQFTLILRVYITSDYEETSILRGPINTPAIWTQDLTGLATNTIWNLKHDTLTGRYTLTHA